MPQSLRHSRIGYVVTLLTALFALLAALPATPVAAATTVTDCTDGDAGSLRAALAAVPVGGTITFTVECPAASPILLTSGTLTIAQNLTVDGSGHTIVVDGGCTANCGTTTAANGVTVFRVNSGVTATLNALTIRHGTASVTCPTSFSNGCGGGILNQGTLIVTNGVISDNAAIQINPPAGGSGGGIYNVGTLTVTNEQISGNTAYGGNRALSSAGGGIASGDISGGNGNPNVSLTVTNTTFTNNSAPNGVGGGIVFGAAGATVTNSTFTGNTAYNGGGIDAGAANPNGGTMTVTNCIFTGNGGAMSNLGGGIRADGGTNVGNPFSLIVTNTVFGGNSASFGGGLENEVDATVTRSTFSGNTAINNGGGIDNEGSLTLTNSTISNNTVTHLSKDGGGIYNNAFLTATNDTISGNSATRNGGGVIVTSVGTAFTATNTIIAGNVSPTGPDVNGAVGSGGHNLVGKTDGSGGWITSDKTGTTGLPLDPKLAALADNGGALLPDGTHPQTQALNSGSPAIDAADDTVCAQAGTGDVNNVDERGVHRPQGPHCDIGAFEVQVITVNPLPPPQPAGPVQGGPPPALPPPRPVGSLSGVAPNPLPVRRP